MKTQQTLESRVSTLLLAGGKGTRLFPLTEDRPKPLVPFGGLFRVIDFTLSNCRNSGLQSVRVLTQYKRKVLHDHLLRHWSGPEPGDRFVEPVPPVEAGGYRGTADAVVRNLRFLEGQGTDWVVVLSADHIYKMDYRELIRCHAESGADVTIATVEHPRELSTDFGIVECNSRSEVLGFQEKPQDPRPVPGKPDRSLVSMGIYVFNMATLRRLASAVWSGEVGFDLGGNVIPRLLDDARIAAYRFRGVDGGNNYWRDVGTVETYYDASMDLIGASPVFDPYGEPWPIRITNRFQRWQKTVLSEAGKDPEICSVVPHSTRMASASVYRSVLSPGVTVEAGARVHQSILMPGVRIGRGASVRNAVIDEYAEIAPDDVIGYDAEHDRERFGMTDGGIVVVPSTYRSHRPAVVRHFVPVSKSKPRVTGGIAQKASAG